MLAYRNTVQIVAFGLSLLTDLHVYHTGCGFHGKQEQQTAYWLQNGLSAVNQLRPDWYRAFNSR